MMLNITIAFLVALVTMTTLISCETVSKESLSVLERLILMEQHLQQQSDLQAVQQADLERLNRLLMSRSFQQDARLSQQEERLFEQAETIRQQGRNLSQEGRKLQEQETIIKQQGAKLCQQEDILSEQGKTIRLQDSKLSQQENKLRDQGKIISQQDARLSQQDQIINFLVDNFIPAVSLNSALLQTEQKQNWGASVTSTHHAIIARSDDTGPLGVVVNEMNQRMTQMSADIQAMKNTDIKHASDIHSIKASHISDIQALKASQASDIHALTLTNKHQDQAIIDARSSSFICWGSSQCPDNSSLVYSGVVGGSNYNQTGAAVNYLCLTMSPMLAYSVKSYTDFATLYGGEYQTDINNKMNSDPVCAVCRARFSTTIMIPGTHVCISGWTPLYNGYLLASNFKDPAGSEFVCVDAALESRPGSAHNDDGKLFHFTKTRCGSLPCGPYVNDQVVTCVVCGQ